LLRRIAPTDADLPPGFGKPDAGFKDSAQLAGVASDPGTAKDQWDRAGLVLAYESGFESGSGGSSPTDGTVRAVMHTGYAFATPEGAGAWLDEAAGELEPAARALIDGQGGDIRTEQITDLSLGDEAVAWRASGPSEAVGWVIAVRRGAGGFLLTLDGSGPAVDRVARDLGVRLDQRMAAAMP
jgi:hypothetical protein